MKELFNKLTPYYFIIFFVIVGFFLLLPVLTKSRLNDWDECVYAQYGKEMKQSGHFLTYRWNKQRIFEKPPLYGWLMQIPFIFGVNEFTARILSLVAGLVILLLVYFYAKNYFSKFVSVLSILVLIQSHFFISSFTFVNADIIGTVFIFSGFYLWMKSDENFYFAYLAGLMFGLAIMARGLIAGIVPFSLFITTLLLFDKNKLINYIRLFATLFIVITPWHLYEIVRHSEDFVKVYFIDNLYMRSINGIFGSRPFYYYLNIITRDSFPWFLLLPILLVVFIRNIKKNFQIRLSKIFVIFSQFKNGNYFTVIMCTILFFVLISLAKTRVKIYLIPIFPFYAITLALVGNKVLLHLKRYQFILIFIILLILNLFKNISPNLTFKYTSNKFAEYEEIFFELKKNRIDQIEYLVHPDWRKHIKNSKMIPAQFAYGDIPCIVYYTGKKVNLYYDVDRFKKYIFRGVKALFILNNEDLSIINGLPMEIKASNSAYTIFEN